MQVELVTRVGCHLCGDALNALLQLGLQPQLVDVDSDDELRRLYDFRVPVVLVDGRPVLEGKVSKERLAEVLTKR